MAAGKKKRDYNTAECGNCRFSRTKGTVACVVNCDFQFESQNHSDCVYAFPWVSTAPLSFHPSKPPISVLLSRNTAVNEMFVWYGAINGHLARRRELLHAHTHSHATHSSIDLKCGSVQICRGIEDGMVYYGIHSQCYQIICNFPWNTLETCKK